MAWIQPPTKEISAGTGNVSLFQILYLKTIKSNYFRAVATAAYARPSGDPFQIEATALVATVSTLIVLKEISTHPEPAMIISIGKETLLIFEIHQSSNEYLDFVQSILLAL